MDRNRIRKAFESFTAHYDPRNPDIRQKAEHTYRVAENCETIAGAEGLDRELAWLTGMLHDLGRFPQLEKYNTFWDPASMNHAEAGAEMLFGKADLIRKFIDDEEYDPLIEKAVRYHSAYRLPEGLTAEEKAYCHLLRDADKLDISRVFSSRPPEDIFKTTGAEFAESRISGPVMEQIRECSSVKHELKKTPADRYAGILSLVFELYYPSAQKMAAEQGFYRKLLDVRFLDSGTNDCIREIGSIAESRLKMV